MELLCFITYKISDNYFWENPDLFYFTNVTDEISISDLEEISIS